MTPSVVDGIEQVSNDDSFDMASKAARVEGIPVGISSGAALTAAFRLAARDENAGKTIVVIIPSFAERYLSTALFEEATPPSLKCAPCVAEAAGRRRLPAGQPDQRLRTSRDRRPAGRDAAAGIARRSVGAWRRGWRRWPNCPAAWRACCCATSPRSPSADRTMRVPERRGSWSGVRATLGPSTGLMHGRASRSVGDRDRNPVLLRRDGGDGGGAAQPDRPPVARSGSRPWSA
jgi:hypothetical protein